VDAVLVQAGQMIGANRARIAALAAQHRLPTMGSSWLVQPGGKKNPFHVRPHWYIMVAYAQTTLPKE
jgi:hypothetical protein